MTSQIQHAQRIRALVDNFFRDNRKWGYNAALRDFLVTEYGFTVLGYGYFSIVILHPENNDLVIKVTAGGDRAHLDDGYMDFVAACMRAPKSKHLPEFHAALVGKQCAVTVMKRYRPVNPHTDARYGFESDRVLSAFRFADGVMDAGMEYVISVCGRATDLHDENYMWDVDQDCVVVTDPYSNRNRIKNEHRVERYIDKQGRLTVDVQVEHLHEPYKQSLVKLKAVDLNSWFKEVQKQPVAPFRVNVLQPAHAWLPEHLLQILTRKVQAREEEPASDKRAFVDRTGKEPTFREQAEDRMLRPDAVMHDLAQQMGIPGALLPGQGSRRVHPARSTIAKAVGREAHCVILDTRGALEWPADRLYVHDPCAKHVVAS
jgi:hypothetical protein